MRNIMDIIGVVIGSALLLLIAFWWISVPLYYILLAREWFSIGRDKRESGRTRGLHIVVAIQALLPLLAFMDFGWAGWSGEYAGCGVALVLSLLGFPAFGLIRIITRFTGNKTVEPAH